jgi:methionyl-tRNA formyltransferase
MRVIFLGTEDFKNTEKNRLFSSSVHLVLVIGPLTTT